MPKSTKNDAENKVLITSGFHIVKNIDAYLEALKTDIRYTNPIIELRVVNEKD